MNANPDTNDGTDAQEPDAPTYHVVCHDCPTEEIVHDRLDAAWLVGLHDGDHDIEAEEVGR